MDFNTESLQRKAIFERIRKDIKNYVDLYYGSDLTKLELKLPIYYIVQKDTINLILVNDNTPSINYESAKFIIETDSNSNTVTTLSMNIGKSISGTDITKSNRFDYNIKNKRLHVSYNFLPSELNITNIEEFIAECNRVKLLDTY